jgi:OmpA-OmpF porin, OOP family
MTRKLFLALFMGASLSIMAQKAPETGKYKLFSNDQTEVGVHAGVIITQTDATNKVRPGFGGGVYFRKALDYTFSVRGDLSYNVVKGATNAAVNYNVYDGKQIDSYTGKFYGITADLLIGLGNNRFDVGKRSISPYVFFGVGGGQEKTDLAFKGGTSLKDVQINPRATTKKNGYGWFDGGVGINFRVNDKMSFGLESKLYIPLGARADFLDAVVREQKDIPIYTSARLGFNIGGGKDAKKVAPLWWANPAEQVQADIADLKKRPVFDPTDTDSDGVVDATDQEKDTPAGARVDTRGVALDSDGDSYPDYKDKEPFSPVGFKVDAQGIAQVPKPAYVTEADVDRIVNARIGKLEATMAASPTNKAAAPSMADWFLPMIHFDLDKDLIKQAEYGNLAAVAQVMKSNPGISIVVSGHTDKLSSDSYNQGLSYRRANNAVNTLVSRFGVDRSRLIINYGGENTTLVPTSGNSYMNRRVEFKVAQGETEQGAPAGGMKKKSYKGNKNAGY